MTVEKSDLNLRPVTCDRLLLLTDSLDLYQCIFNYIQEINQLTHFRTTYKLELITEVQQCRIQVISQHYPILILDSKSFGVISQEFFLQNIAVIVLCENELTGLTAIQSGADDYWNLPNLDLFLIERSLRLILNSHKLVRLDQEPNNNFYQNFFNNCVDGLFSVNVLDKQTLVYGIVNSAFADLIGIPKAQIIGKKITEVLPHLEERKYLDCLCSQKNISYEHSLQIAGKLHTWLIVLVPVKNEQGICYQIQGSARNITKEKQSITQQIKHTRYRNLLRSISLKIRQSLNIKNILNTTVIELQKVLQTERVIILQFVNCHSGKIIEESVQSHLPSMLGEVINKQYYQQVTLDNYEAGYLYAWENIETAQISLAYKNLLKKYQVRANLVIPIIKRSIIYDSQNLYSNSVTNLWGLLCVHQCTQTRKWTTEEIELLQQLVEQLNIALSQAELLKSEVKQRQELARSNIELEQFAYVASHDLQAPLQTISNYAQLLEHRYQKKLDEKADKYIKYIVEAAYRMRQQIEDLLEYSRVNRQQNTFRETDFSLVIKQAIANLNSDIEHNQAVISYNDNFPKLIVDHSQFTLLFQNILSNSLKYRSNHSPQIKIAVKQQDHNWQFSITDNGIGIAEKHYQRIFQIFQRLHTQDEYPGTGIGLAICQKIVQRHGGDIWLKSIPNQGTTFYFTIPKQANSGLEKS